MQQDSPHLSTHPDRMRRPGTSAAGTSARCPPLYQTLHAPVEGGEVMRRRPSAATSQRGSPPPPPRPAAAAVAARSSPLASPPLPLSPAPLQDSLGGALRRRGAGRGPALASAAKAASRSAAGESDGVRGIAGVLERADRARKHGS
jgi:hypothetical protein